MDFYNKFDDKYEINVYLRTAIIVVLFSYYETRKKSILVNIELYNVDEQIKNHFY